MKLSALSPELFRRALALYFEQAYREGDPPESVQPDTSGLETADDVLALFTAEPRPHPEGVELHHYVLRLGNDRYPHMKLALMEFLEPGVWVWAVETHDELPLSPESPDWEKWRELRIHNLEVKASVEAAWRGEGLHTCRVVARELPEVEQSQAGPLVLVVDDEQGMRSAAVNMLRAAGYRVVEAESGLEAIERYLMDEPDLVLMDYDMPQMDGLELLTRLRGLPGREGRRIPILMATAGNLDLSSTPGLDGFLVKPYQRTLLLSFVHHQLPWENKESQSAPEGADDL